jgi:O-methyltransferase involved in polyketide biosynthesis
MTTAPLNLTGVPETMLWTLHNRASEARRPDALLVDPECVRIYEAIDYDFVSSFGKPEDSHPMRSRLFDEALRPWLRAHPGGTVVELGAGLETQFQRCDDGQVRWLCVDVPEAITVRERFLPATGRCRHIACSALDPAWLDAVDASRGVFVTAQGLLMYFEEQEVRRLFKAIIDRFPGVEIMFDVIPRWFSKKTLRGFAKTTTYTTPAMPWGANRYEVEALLRSWSPAVKDVRVVPYGIQRGFGVAVHEVCMRLPLLRNMVLCIVHVST